MEKFLYCITYIALMTLAFFMTKPGQFLFGIIIGFLIIGSIDLKFD